MRRGDAIGLVAGALVVGCARAAAAAVPFAVSATVDTGAGSLNRVRFAPDGTLFVVAAASGTGIVYTPEGAVTVKLSPNRGPMFVARFDAASRRIVTPGYDGSVTVWSRDGQQISNRRLELAAVTDALFTRDGNALVHGSDNGSTTLMTLEGSVRWRIERPGVARTVGMSPDGALFATSSDEGTLTLLGADGAVKAAVPTGQGRLNSVVFSPDGTRLVTSGRDGNVVVWSAQGRQQRRYTPPADFGGFANDADFTPDGKRIIAVFDDGSLLDAPVDGAGGTRVKVADVRLTSVACAPRGQRCVATGSDGRLRLIELGA